MNAPRAIFFVGKPGSGKGTQAALLAGATGWPIASMSGGLRAIAARGGTIAEKLRETMDAGLLTPHWMASFVYLSSIIAAPKKGGIIFDGTSRTLPEAKLILESLRWIGLPFTILYLSVSDNTVRARIELRKKEEARADDHTLDTRLATYDAETASAIDYYRGAGVLTEIDGEPAPEIIAARIREVLKIS